MTSAIHKANIRPVHPFPARMAPSIVWDALSSESGSLKVLDPMSGSGTTLVCARALGHQAIGCDRDPLARLIAQAWCADIDCQVVTNRANIVLERAKKMSDALTPNTSHPENVDDETCKFIDFWFDAISRRQLTALATCISRVRSESEKIMLWCAFSKMIITKKVGVSLAWDVSHSRPHRKYRKSPAEPFSLFLKALSKIISNSYFTENNKHRLPSSEICCADARSLPIKSSSIDVIITSPPYLNAIDYLRGHKLSLVWMGHNISEIRHLRSENIGSETKHMISRNAKTWQALKKMGNTEALNKRDFGIVCHYILDMDIVIKECARVLKSKGKSIFVVGNSSLHGVFIKNSDALIALANIHGLSLVSEKTRPLEMNKRYLPPPESSAAGGNMRKRMREEVILQFQA